MRVRDSVQNQTKINGWEMRARREIGEKGAMEEIKHEKIEQNKEMQLIWRHSNQQLNTLPCTHMQAK